jgi:hypothetical protein
MMATQVWPATLPQCPILNSFSEQRQRNLAAIQKEVGLPRMYRRSTAVATLTSAAYRMNVAQLAAFSLFYETNLASGSLPFKWEHPITNTLYVWMFDPKDTPRIERMTSNTFRISFNLLRMP